MKKPFFRFVLIFACLVAIAAIMLKINVFAQAKQNNRPPQPTFACETIPLSRQDVWERYDREKLAFTYMHTSSTLLWKRAPRFFPLIEPILKANNIPDDFKYLAAIESTLDPQALSPAGAAGIWQLLEETAKEYGLEVSDEIDERYHIEKATEAACRYLKNSHDTFGSWISAAAAYNMGTSRLKSEKQEQQCKSIFDMHLNKETNRYIFRLFAAKAFLQNPAEFGFTLKKEDTYPIFETDKIKVDGSIKSWPAFANEHKCTYAEFKMLNPWIKNTTLTNSSKKTYWVNVPK